MKKRIKKDKDDPVGGKPGEKGLSMKFLNKLERKFGRYAVPNLMLYIIILNAAGLLITIMYPQAQYYLCWSTSAILHGQIWRIVSFILVPYTTSPVNFLIFAFLYLNNKANAQNEIKENLSSQTMVKQGIVLNIDKILIYI